jgi:four helix bundle protein
LGLESKKIMARIEKFEDLMSWQRARALTGLVYQVSRQGDFAKDFGLRDQMRRASVSILSNIAEGFERGGDKEFQQFLSNAKGSCAEVRAQLYVALDEKYISDSQFNQMKELSSEIGRLISGMMAYLSSSEIKGRKFKPATQDSRL